MNSRDRKLVLAALVLTLAGASGYWGLHRSTDGPSGVKPPTGSGPHGPLVRIARILPGDDSRDEGINLFNYRRREGLISPTAPIGPDLAIATPIPTLPGPAKPPQSPGPAPGPVRSVDNLIDLPLVYSGFARDDSGEMTAFLETNGQGNVPAGHFNLKEDDYFVGRLKVTKITPDTVEVEDMDRSESAAKRKQVFSLKK